jgi:hypothetical protein
MANVSILSQYLDLEIGISNKRLSRNLFGWIQKQDKNKIHQYFDQM